MTRSAQRLDRVVALRNQYLLAIDSLPIGAVIPADQKAWRWQVLFSVCLSPLLLCISVELCLVKIVTPVNDLHTLNAELVLIKLGNTVTFILAESSLLLHF